MSEENTTPIVAPITESVVPTVEPVTIQAQPQAVAQPQVVTSQVNDDLESMFTGTAVMDTAGELNLVTMKDGIAVVKSVELATSKGGHPMVVIKFSEKGKEADETRGHIQHISCTEGYRWANVIRQVRHFVKIANNPTMSDNFNKCFNVLNPDDNTIGAPFKTLKNDLGQKITFKEWEELGALQLKMQDADITYMYADKKDRETKTAVKFHNPLEFCTSASLALLPLVNSMYSLKFGTNKKGFQIIKQIRPVQIG